MKTFPSLRVVLFFSIGAGLACAQTVPPPATPPKPDEPVALDTVVVTGSADPRAAFDLAQGASVLAGDALRSREAATLGETLSALPGVSSTYYGPGASRPIIRGLGGDRVRMLDNGVGSLDVSNISPDHNVSLDPLLIERIEVLRGPSALLYGGSAVGGVVNVFDNRIPSAPPAVPLTGRAEARYGSAANERTGVFTTTAGVPKFAVQISGLRTLTDDVAIPGVAQTGAGAPPGQPVGTLPSSAIDTKSGSVGSSYFWPAGFVGFAVSEYDTTYGVPTGDVPPTSIDMKQRRLDFRAEITRPFGVFAGAKARLGFADYTHSELSGGTVVNTTFTNKAWEGRLDLLQEAVGNLTGSVGVQAARADFASVGAEVVAPPSVTDTAALFAVEEFKLGTVTLQAGARVERQRIALGTVPAGLPVFAGQTAVSNQHRSSDALSVSLGAVWHPAADWSLALALASTERLPTTQELFSNGPHGGTGAYEVGTSGLAKEKSLGLDLTLRKRAGFVTGSAGVFLNRFSGYIFEQDIAAVPVLNNPDGLPAFQFTATDALFYGGETEVSFHLIDEKTERLHFDLGADYVRAEDTTAHAPLPRMPPLRANVGLRYERGPWTAGVEVRHAFSQNHFTATETATPGYTLLNASLSYAFTVGRTQCEVFLRGTNLANAEARVSTSFLKDFAPLPGRDVTLGVQVNF